ncbi:M16 family metallopeptidase [Luteibacter sp. Lutesp34]|uniref:M16 family metallopeptidase n=1 Tax=Luteibacter sp. Lutesp34 TaxID=3243030 RepID=UPI0039B4C922
MAASFSGTALLRVAIFASLGVLAVWPVASAADVLAYRNLRLPNGLKVVVHEDHSAPIVSLAVWYRVGSADEPAGRTGFAHLFEHLMFRGSKHYNAPFLDAMQDMGGGNVNADTSFDHTAYYATVPTVALDRALWLESDRMGHLLDPLDQARLTTERAVVRNERRDTLDLPYARIHPHLLRHLFPANHPYHHDVDGHAADLDNVTVEDARAWFRNHYGAANATLVMAGDITPEAAREKAMTYFGDLAPGPDLVRQQPWVVPLRVAARGTMHDHITTRRIVRAWPIPEAGTDAAARLRLAARILGDGTASRLHTRLVVQDRVASDVSAYVPSLALAGMLWLIVDVAEGADSAAVESALDDELRRFVADGPDSDEMALAQVRENSDFLAGTERMDTKARRLALGQALHDDPGEEWAAQLRMAHADAESVRREAAVWLTRPSYTLTVLPAPEEFDAEAEDASDAGLGIADGQPAPAVVATGALRASHGWAVDRQVPPPVVESAADFSFPAVHRRRLRGGSTLVSTQRTGSPFVRINFLFGGGSAGDFGRLPGTALFTMSLLGGAATMQANRLGATFETGCEVDACMVGLRVPRERLQAGLALMVDAIRHGVGQDDIDRVRTQRLAATDTGTTTSFGIAHGLMNRLLFGNSHPYGFAAFPQGTRESLQALNADAVGAYRRDYLRRDNLTVVMVGDVTHEEGARLLESAFEKWMPPATPVPSVPVHVVTREVGDTAYLVDRPGARQAHIAVGSLAPPAGDDLNLDLAGEVFADLPSSRLNANLRQDKGWSYGVAGGMSRQGGQRTFTFHAPVQADRTADAVAEIRREISALVDGSAPLSETEVDSVRTGLARSLTAALQTDKAVMLNLSSSVKLGRRDDFWQTLPAVLRGLRAARVSGALEDLLRTQGRTWVIVGDRGSIEAQLRQQFPALHIVDADGRIVD